MTDAKRKTTGKPTQAPPARGRAPAASAAPEPLRAPAAKAVPRARRAAAKPVEPTPIRAPRGQRTSAPAASTPPAAAKPPRARAKPKTSVGRPSKLTPEVIEALATHLASGMTTAEAAREIGVSGESVRNWLKWGALDRDSEYGALYAAVEKARRDRLPDPEKRPRTREALNDWFEDFLGSRLPATAVCEGHDAPLDVAWDIFDNQVDEAIVLGSRSGGKTLLLAMVHTANGYWKRAHTTTHFGSVERQARRAYEHYDSFISRDRIRVLIKDSGSTRTSWRNGSVIEILPGTEKQSQGPHTFVVSWDELESGERQPYENARGIPIEDPDGNPGQFITTSTRQKRGGLMQQALDDAPRRGARIYTFCVWETIQPCEIPETCEHEDEDHSNRDDPLAFYCPQPLSRYTAGKRLDLATGWRSVRDVVATYKRMARDTFEVQVLNMRPEAGALLYPTFTEANITEAAEYEPGRGVLWGYDAGFNDPTWIGFFQLRNGAFHLFDEISGQHRSERFWVREGIKRVLELPDYEGPTLDEWQEYWEGRRRQPKPWPRVWPHASGDPTAGHFHFELREHGVGWSPGKKVRHDVPVGQSVLRAAFQSAGALKFFVHPRCVIFRKAVESYQSVELPDGSYGELPDPSPSNHAFSHPCDGARYLVYRYRRELGITAASGAEAE